MKKTTNDEYFNYAMKWAYDLELFDMPQVQNHLYVNIYSQSKRISNAELILNQNERKLLILLEFDLFARIFSFLQTRIITNLQSQLSELMPNYKIRVINDVGIFNKSLKLLDK